METDTYTCLDLLMTGTILRNLIKKSGYSVKSLQEKLNLSCPQPIYRWMKGQTMPSLDNLYILGKILGVHMEEMLMPREDEIWLMEWSLNITKGKRMVEYLHQNVKNREIWSRHQKGLRPYIQS